MARRPWTEQQKAEHGARLRAAHAARRLAGLPWIGDSAKVREAIAKESCERISDLYCDTMAEFQEFATRHGLNFRGELIDLMQRRMRRRTRNGTRNGK